MFWGQVGIMSLEVFRETVHVNREQGTKWLKYLLGPKTPPKDIQMRNGGLIK